MARGDRKPASGGRGSYGGGSSYSYDDEGRGNSKSYYDIFERHFEESGWSADWLLADFSYGTESTGYIRGWAYFEEGMPDEFLFNFLEAATYRYNIHDFATRAYEDPPGNDGRARRLVIDKCDVKTWRKLQERARRVWDTVRERKAQQRELQQAKEAARQAAFKAERIQRDTELKQQLMQHAEHVAGTLRSDINVAFTTAESYNRDEGDYIEDVVIAYKTGHGFAVEEQKATGVKLQVTLSIDLSNSMQYNYSKSGTKLYEAASNAFRDVWLALEQLESEHEGDLFVAAFTFAKDAWEYRNGRHVDLPGKAARCLTVESDWRGNIRSADKKRTGDVGDLTDEGEVKFGPVSKFKEPMSYMFSGTDTWFYTLFERIEQWERKCSDPGAIKLDLIITDAVMEHPTDITRSDAVQERRDGTLHTVMLNMQPKEDWANSDLPLRCVQYPADEDNLVGMLRMLIAEFVNIYI